MRVKTELDGRFAVLAATLLCFGSTGVEAATIPVTNTADNGPGSLRAAIASAANGDTVDATGVSGTITLTSGELQITNSLNVNGPGPINLAINGNFPTTTNGVFIVSGGATVNLSGLTITNGHRDFGGGGIFNGQSALTLSNCNITGNSGGSYGTGGGILSFGGSSSSARVTVVNSIISGNSAMVGGGIYNSGEIGPATLTVIGSTISGNIAGGAGGGGIKNDGSPTGSATVNMTNCTISGNSTTGNGGGIQNDGLQGHATLSVVRSTLSGNSADVAGGSFGGGAIYNDGSMGGNAPVTLINTTLSGNFTGSLGGGIRNGSGFGGGSTTLTLLSCTLSSNYAPVVGGIMNIGHIDVGNSILNASNSSSNISTFSGTVTSLGYNLCSDSGAGVLTNATDQINVDPMLGPLQDNGGPVFTHALLTGSPTIDQGKNLSGDATDARGFPRTFDDPAIPNAAGGDGTDIGAYEAAELRITAMDTLGADLRLSFACLAGRNYELQSRSDLNSGLWNPLPGSVRGNGGIAQATVTNAFGQPQQFYRIHQLP